MMKDISWVDQDMYPFQTRFMNLSNGQMHYIDEGSGKETLLFIHGTPTWSFLYREMIKELAKNHRCIATDHLGFGLSSNIEEGLGTPEWHAENLVEFIKKLNLDKFTLVVHDFGGPIGLAAALKMPSRISKIVLFNSWLWATSEDEAAQKINKVVHSWVGRILYLYFNISPKWLLKKGFFDTRYLTRGVHRHYLKPFPNKRSRQALLTLAQSLVGSSEWYRELWEKLPVLLDHEWLIIWGTKDDFIHLEYLAKWRKRISHAQIVELDCGHYIQEEKAAESITAIEHFLG